jgi:hypothetical protein
VEEGEGEECRITASPTLRLGGVPTPEIRTLRHRSVTINVVWKKTNKEAFVQRAVWVGVHLTPFPSILYHERQS